MGHLRPDAAVLTVVSKSDLRWTQKAPKMTKINKKTETYNYWAPLTKPVEDLEQINSATEKQVRHLHLHTVHKDWN